MKHEFWLERWEQNQIGFHQADINRYLSGHWAELGLPEGAPVFVPLCGKSLDMLWLREQGHPVFGVEISRMAVEAFFHENDIEPDINETDRFVEFCTDDMCIFNGDFFALKPHDLGEIHAIFDRASLIALPPEMRMNYAKHIATLLPSGAHILLVTMEYPEGTLEGPPFSVSEEEMHSLYDANFDITLKGTWEGEGPRGIAVTEKVYLLTKR